MSKVVAAINIKNFGEVPDLQLEGYPEQEIKVGQAVRVRLPDIFIRGKRMPRINIDLEVRRKADEGILLDFAGAVTSNIDGYKDFWNRRKQEAKSGIFLP